MKNIINKIETQKYTIGIIGMGYVGLPLSLAFAEAGYRVIGFDIDQNKIDKLLVDKESYINHISSDRIRYIVDNKKIDITLDFLRISEVDAIILCLPTPLNKYREPDLSYIKSTMSSIKPFLRKGQLLSLESTTYPGTTEEELKPIIEEMGFEVGQDFFLVYSPEREDPGNADFKTSTIPKVIGGVTNNCLEVGITLYGKVINKMIPVESTKAAELTKLLENIYRAVNIGLVNEMKVIADKMDIDIWEVIDAASSKPFGFTPFYPGPGLGGHCIPIDPFYLTWKAKEYDINTKFIELSGEVNTMMPKWVIGKVMEGLNEQEKSLKNSNVLVLGLAYKKNVDDTRESPSVKLMELLMKKGANVFYSDPHISKFPNMREYYFDIESIEINKDTLKNMDCILISTDHDDFDYDLILKYGKLIVDTRGRYRENYKNVIKA